MPLNLIDRYNPANPGRLGVIKTDYERQQLMFINAQLELAQLGLLVYEPLGSTNPHNDILVRTPDDRFYRVHLKWARRIIAKTGNKIGMKVGQRYYQVALKRGRKPKRKDGRVMRKKSSDILSRHADVMMLCTHTQVRAKRNKFVYYYIPLDGVIDPSATFYMSHKILETKYKLFPFQKYYTPDLARGREKWCLIQTKLGDEEFSEADYGENMEVVDV